MDRQRRILIVEDEAHLALGIQFNLEAEGYLVEVATDGADAIERVDEPADAFDLVVLDLMMPGMSGYAVCESLRESGHFMPILILSARTLPEDRARGFDAGADQYLTKPFELDELISRVKNLIARHEKAAARQKDSANVPVEFSFGTAMVNFDTHEASVDGNTIRLTPLELRLLEYFVTNEGRVIPRGELLVNVWDMPPHLKTRAPDQIIRRLRKRFEPQPEAPIHFLTIRDGGYRFVATP